MQSLRLETSFPIKITLRLCVLASLAIFICMHFAGPVVGLERASAVFSLILIAIPLIIGLFCEILGSSPLYTNIFSYPLLGNFRHLARRLTALVTLVFILAYSVQWMSVVIGLEFRFSLFSTSWVYFTFFLFALGHFSIHLWEDLIYFGVTVSRLSQTVMAWICLALFAASILFFLPLY
jgi:hypothetical protein